MIFTLPSPGLRKDNIFIAFLMLLGTAGGACCFTLSYLYHSNFILGVLLFPYVLVIDGKSRANYIYIFLIVLLGGVALMYGVRIAYFFALAFFVLWLIEYFVGRCNPLILFLLFFMSPFFSQVTTILGFPLRLQLSSLSGFILQQAGLDVAVEGNLILLDGSMFSVDEACMGLNMLSMSMLLSTFLMAHQYRITSRRLGLFSLALYFILTFGLNAITNLFRIVVLVLFRVPPEDPLHEILGLICFVVYLAIPLYFISGWIIKKGKTVVHENNERPSLVHWQKMLMVLFSVAVFVVGFKINIQKENKQPQNAVVSYPNGKIEKLGDGITKIFTPALLLYVKPIPEFFSGEHTPLICWKGSGYVFKGIKEANVGGRSIYIGKLVHDQHELYTAWWYDNGKIQTISQLDWRVRMLKGEGKFCIVNVTAKDEVTLMKHVTSIFKNNSLNIRFDE